MRYDFNFDGILNYDDDQVESPDMVIAELGKQLEKATNGFIKGVVKEYDGPVESCDYGLSAFASIASALGTSTVHKNIQDSLGAVGFHEYKFEFFLTAPKIENYKYRVLFFEYGIGMYPVKIILEQGIADEIFKKENADYVIEYATKAELENVILNILKTKKVTQVMQELIYAMRRFERLDKERHKLMKESSDDERGRLYDESGIYG